MTEYCFSKKRLVFLYGKWTERLRVCEPSLYDDTLERIKRDAKSPQNSPGHKKVLAKLHSFKVGAFKPSHQDAIDESSTDGEDCLPVDEIPGSITLWEVTPRPPNCSDVNIYLFVYLLRKNIMRKIIFLIYLSLIFIHIHFSIFNLRNLPWH